MEDQDPPITAAQTDLDSGREWASLGRLGAALSGITIVTFLAYASLGSAGLGGAALVAVGAGGLAWLVAMAVYFKHSVRFGRAYLDEGGTFLGRLDSGNTAAEKRAQLRGRVIGAVVVVLLILLVVAATVVVRLRS